MLSLFDLHCDTALSMLRSGQPLRINELDVSLEQARVFERYVQVMALWTPHTMNDEEGWQNMLAMLQNLRDDPALKEGEAEIITSLPVPPKKPNLLLSIEDVRILAGRIQRVEELWRLGIRLITPLWQGETCIGGSHDTQKGLTPFGRSALEKAVTLGMILDISHASLASAEEMFEICEGHHRPLIASHSDVHAICPVSRNLTDEQIRRIIKNNGLIGINLYVSFLKENGTATAADALPHIDRILSLGGENVLALGGDMDGCELPPDIPSLSHLPRLAEYMAAHNYPDELIHRIFYQNAFDFANKYLK